MDRYKTNLFVAFQRQYVMVFNVLELEKVKMVLRVGPLSPCVDQPIFIDDYCTYLAHLDGTRRQVKYHLFNYQYHCHQPLAAPELEPSQAATKRQQTATYRDALARYLEEAAARASTEREQKIQAGILSEMKASAQTFLEKIAMTASRDLMEAGRQATSSTSRVCTIF